MKSFVGMMLVVSGLLATHLGCCCAPGGMDMCGGGVCGAGPCEPSCGLPFAGVRSRIAHGIANRLTGAHCNSACGEIYWDEQINEPRKCDPCGCDNEFTCRDCGPCPRPLGRLREWWNHGLYVPQSCDSCSSGADPVTTTSCSCASCMAGHGASDVSQSDIQVHGTQSSSSIITQPSGAARSTPTPATPRSSHSPAPVPDPNAFHDVRNSDERVVIGSGVAPKKTSTTKTVPARTTSARPKLTTR